MTQLIFSDILDSSDFDPTMSTPFYYKIEIISNDETPGTFRYEITGDDVEENKSEDAYEAISNIWGHTFTCRSSGLCTWTSLPDECQNQFLQLISPEEKTRFLLVDTTVICDGELVISRNKF